MGKSRAAQSIESPTRPRLHVPGCRAQGSKAKRPEKSARFVFSTHPTPTNFLLPPPFLQDIIDVIYLPAGIGDLTTGLADWRAGKALAEQNKRGARVTKRTVQTNDFSHLV